MHQLLDAAQIALQLVQQQRVLGARQRLTRPLGGALDHRERALAIDAIGVVVIVDI